MGVAPPYRARRLAHAICRRAVATLALWPRWRPVRAGCPLLWAQAIPFRSAVPPPFASHPHVPVGDPSAL